MTGIPKFNECHEVLIPALKIYDWPLRSNQSADTIGSASKSCIQTFR